MRKESCGAEPEKGIPRSQCSELEKGIYLGYGCPSASISVKVAARAHLSKRGPSAFILALLAELSSAPPRGRSLLSQVVTKQRLSEVI